MAAFFFVFFVKNFLVKIKFSLDKLKIFNYISVTNNFFYVTTLKQVRDKMNKLRWKNLSQYYRESERLIPANLIINSIKKFLKGGEDFINLNFFEFNLIKKIKKGSEG